MKKRAQKAEELSKTTNVVEGDSASEETEDMGHETDNLSTKRMPLFNLIPRRQAILLSFKCV